MRINMFGGETYQLRWESVRVDDVEAGSPDLAAG